MNMIGASPLSWAGSAIAASDRRAAGTRRRVLAAMREAAAPLAVAEIAAHAKLSYHRVYRAILTLCAMRAVTASGGVHNRRYALSNTGTGAMTGGPASESAVTALAGSCSTGTARPGDVAA